MIYLTLRAQTAAPGWPIRLAVTEGETIAIVLARFNAYRSPERQIKELYSTKWMIPLSASMRLTESMVAVVLDGET